ncbi:hypothetical protein CI610_03720 [invertebrate metagenome]|uniref:Uncharacterized protein n=1 Tax=invertebrate metagenome TaxID=1711999 RepID=A0A2H9T2B0_9ZZZZ
MHKILTRVGILWGVNILYDTGTNTKYFHTFKGRYVQNEDVRQPT